MLTATLSGIYAASYDDDDAERKPTSESIGSMLIVE